MCNSLEDIPIYIGRQIYLREYRGYWRRGWR